MLLLLRNKAIPFLLYCYAYWPQAPAQRIEQFDSKTTSKI